MWALAKRSGLDLNSPYAYVMWGDYHAATSVVATLDDAVVGYITGFRVPDAPGRVFVWQIAVDEHQRGHGIGGRMRDEMVRRAGAEAIEATVTPETATPAAPLRAPGARHGPTDAAAPPSHEPPLTKGHPHA